jgi:hypothetical protein
MHIFTISQLFQSDLRCRQFVLTSDKIFFIHHQLTFFLLPFLVASDSLLSQAFPERINYCKSWGYQEFLSSHFHFPFFIRKANHRLSGLLSSLLIWETAILIGIFVAWPTAKNMSTWHIGKISIMLLMESGNYDRI